MGFACFGADCDMLFECFDSSSDGKICITNLSPQYTGINKKALNARTGKSAHIEHESAIEEATQVDLNGNLIVLEELRKK